MELAKMRSQILQAIDNIQGVSGRAEMNNLTDKYSTSLYQMVGKKDMVELKQAFLATLWFPQITDRYQGVPQAYRDTFGWVLDPRSSHTWSNFLEWSLHESSIYWVTGKPGSGKSTLMKYLINQPRTKELLERWIAPLPLFTASHFFWNAGYSMQKSHIGLFQSLLYNLLSRMPELVPVAFERRWQNFRIFGGDLHPWSLPELMEALDRLIRSQATAAGFCLFIDGLDECEGDLQYVVDMLQNLNSSQNVKICLSSRPWLVFEDAFSKGPKLRPQDLIYSDIVHYATDHLEKSVHYQCLEQLEPVEAPRLIESIVEKSAGVFLWVYLVVRSLKEGLTNADRISDLQQRLDAMPAELEIFFEHILDDLNPLYLQQAYQLLQIRLLARSEMTVLDMSFADDERFQAAFTELIKLLSTADLLARCAFTVRRLNSRCKGLLEVHKPISGGQPALWDVNFLHRTVRDFLGTINLQGRTGNGFDANVCLSRSVLLAMRANPDISNRSRELSAVAEYFDDAIYYARTAIASTHQPQTSLIDAIDQTAFNVFTSEERRAHLAVPLQRHAYALDFSPDSTMFKKVVKGAATNEQIQTSKPKRVNPFSKRFWSRS